MPGAVESDRGVSRVSNFFEEFDTHFLKFVCIFRVIQVVTIVLVSAIRPYSSRAWCVAPAHT